LTPIAIADLPEALQQLLKEVERSSQPVTITQEGKPFVIIYPATPSPQRPAFGVMQGSGEILGDLISPALLPSSWQVLQ